VQVLGLRRSKVVDKTQIAPRPQQIPHSAELLAQLQTVFGSQLQGTPMVHRHQGVSKGHAVAAMESSDSEQAVYAREVLEVTRCLWFGGCYHFYWGTALRSLLPLRKLSVL